MHQPPVPDQKACIRMLSRLRCGVAPHEGLLYLSVGLEREIELIQRYLGEITRGLSKLIIVERPYGEGKSHMLQLIRELAQAQRCATVYLAHNPLNDASFHHPSMLFHHILQGLQWHHPDIDLKRYDREMSGGYSYWRDREMRDELANRISELTRYLRFTYRGLVIILDEMESLLLLYPRSKSIADEVLSSLCRDILSAEGCCFVLATTPEVTQILKGTFHARLSPPTLTEDMAVALFDRLVALHAEAFGWTPTLKVDARKLYQEVASGAPAGLWRAFVQRVVNLLEIEHQQTSTTAVPPVCVVSPPVATVPRWEAPRIAPLAPSAPPKPKPKIAVGDTVIITGGAMRGCVGRVTEIRGDKVWLVFGRNAVTVQVSIHQLKKHPREESRR